MDKARITELKHIYEKELFENVMPFWEKHTADEQYGGYVHYLGVAGNVLSTDKSMWVQGRQTWLFSRLYNTVERKERWLHFAKLGYDFIRKYGFDERGRMYFTVTQDGRPLRMRRYYFSETFAIIAAAEYSKASGDESAFKFAQELFERVSGYYYEPTEDLLPPKTDPKTRPATGHAVPMIMIATAQVLRECGGDKQKYDKAIEEFIDIILTKFVKREHRALLESVAPDGSIIDTPEGREINPGHAIETSWFIMNEAMIRHDAELLGSACEILEWSFERGWDEQYGGLLSFVDLKGLPPAKMEWDMKYWWPHNELLYASILAHYLTGQKKFEDMFEKAQAYTFSKFPDRKYGEWFGYLHRDGSVAMNVKGNMFKAAFHIPRQLLYTWQLLKRMEQRE